MRIIEREMKSHITDCPPLNNSQASINSDGMLTLRNYGGSPDTDTIIVFTRNESQAIIRLFRELVKIFGHEDLPF